MKWLIILWVLFAAPVMGQEQASVYPKDLSSQLQDAVIDQRSGQQLLEDLFKNAYPVLDALDCPWTSNSQCQVRQCAGRLIGFLIESGVGQVLSANPGALQVLPGASVLWGGLSTGLSSLRLHPLAMALLFSEVLITEGLRRMDLFAGIPTTIANSDSNTQSHGPKTECLGYFPVVGGSMSSCLSLLHNAFCYEMGDNGVVWFCGPLEVTGPGGESATVQCAWSSSCKPTHMVRDFWENVLSTISDVFSGAFDGMVFGGLDGVVNRLFDVKCN